MKDKILKKCDGKRFFVSGGAGFIGSELVRQLSLSGGHSIVYDNFSSGKWKYLSGLRNVKIVKADIRNCSSIVKALRNCDYVINLAALPFIPDSYYYPQEFFDVNTIGTLNLILESIKFKKIKNFVHISTSEVYGTAKKSLMDENHPTLPHSTYAVSKLAADRAVFTIHKEHNFPVVIIRPFNSFGPRITQPYIIPEIAIQLFSKKNEIKLGNIESERDFTYVSDTARGIIIASLSENAIGETINLGSKKSYKVKQLVKLMSSILGKKITIRNDEKRFRPYDVGKLICDNSKAKKLLGWKPTISIKVGLKLTLDWIKLNQITFETPFKGWSKNYRMKQYKKID